MSILGIIFLLFCIVFPILVTINNVNFTFFYPKMDEEMREKKQAPFRMNEKKTEFLTITVGAILCWFYIGVCFINVYGEYNEPIHIGYYHNFIESEHSLSVYLTFAVGLISLLILHKNNSGKLPPIPEALCFGFAVIAEVVFLFYIIQLLKNYAPIILPLIVYLFNIILLTAKFAKRYIAGHLKYNEEHDVNYRFRFGKKLDKKLNTFSKMSMFHFIMILPAAVILLILFVLFGQGTDGIIKAFTMTADWTFSTQIPPPPVDYMGHYLCTVAAGGHKKVVKPVRYGKRRGEMIVVNRQLLASNAFEDMIMERTPKFHRAVRGFYDKHGYPISKYITTQTRADVVYIIMKPLEWLFVLTLYTFDIHPENRIAVQYSDYKR